MRSPHAQRLARLRGLYGIVDDGSPLDPVAWARALASGGARAIQLRFKRTPPRAAIEIGRAVRAACPGVLLLLNDRPDLALLCDADGVHVGEEDLSPADARRVVGPDRLVGATARGVGEARAAIASGADHLGVGPIFPSATKPLAVRPLGLDGLAAVVRALAPSPVVAISGIDGENVASVAQTGCAAAAVIGAIGGAADPEAAARTIARAFEASR